MVDIGLIFVHAFIGLLSLCLLSHSCVRNSATETIKQQLLYVGQETGKLIAMRDIIHKVC